MCVVFHDSGGGYFTTELAAIEKKKVALQRNTFIDELFSKKIHF